MSPGQVPNESVYYGELIVLGYNGLNTIWEDDSAVRRELAPGQPSCRYRLFQRDRPNGVTQCGVQLVKGPRHSKIVQDDTKHSITFTLSKNKAVVLEYAPDNGTDMFQIGRSSEPQIDFTVVDTWLGIAKNAEQVQHSRLQSTISRYACRLLVNRSEPHVARLYAAGFDSSRNIFLGEKAAKWQAPHSEIDGLTTNGILVLHPTDTDDTPGVSTEQSPGAYVWREVSVGGDIYTLRETRSAAKRGMVMETETSILMDGSLIDLCGATLLWRNPEGIAKTPTRKQLESRIDELNAGRPQCPVNLNTLVIPRGRHKPTLADSLPLVYLSCGHVQGRHAWGHGEQDKHTCPLCYTEVSAIALHRRGVEVGPMG